MTIVNRIKCYPRLYRELAKTKIEYGNHKMVSQAVRIVNVHVWKPAKHKKNKNLNRGKGIAV